MNEIKNFHAHVYFDQSSQDQALKLCELAKYELPIEMGRFHEKEVGPHPMWSCQLLFETQDFTNVVLWLMTHRKGLTIFVHGNSGNDYKDHTDHIMWLGESVPLKLDLFQS